MKSRATVLAAFLTGLLFGLGLILAGMSNPAKVLGFLDLAGAWDPSLAFVMAGAIGAMAPIYALAVVARRRTRSLLGEPMQIPASRVIDGRLAFGSALFGVGWGLAGICPGPAVVLLGQGYSQAVLFMAAMLAGMGIFEWIDRRARVGTGMPAPLVPPADA
jgi:uncharacterized membrane protein YedE/YeeE